MSFSEDEVQMKKRLKIAILDVLTTFCLVKTLNDKEQVTTNCPGDSVQLTTNCPTPTDDENQSKEDF